MQTSVAVPPDDHDDLERLAELLASCRPHFRAVEPLPSLPITRGGQIELRLGLARARGFVNPSPVR